MEAKLDQPVGDYRSGVNWGWPDSVKVHVRANIVGKYPRIQVGENTRIDAFVTITGDVEIGRNCHIATGASIFGSSAKVKIGKHCGISVGCAIFTGTDNPDIGLLALHTENELPSGARKGEVTLRDYVTIGANSVVYPGITIGEQTMVGALSYVNKNLLSGWIYVGSPARPLRPRPPLIYPHE